MLAFITGREIQKLIFPSCDLASSEHYKLFDFFSYLNSFIMFLSFDNNEICYFYSEVHFKHLSSHNALPARDVNASSIGKLVCIRGIVTRCTEVKPVVQVATYTCDRCGTESYQTVSCSFDLLCITLLRRHHVPLCNLLAQNV